MADPKTISPGEVALDMPLFVVMLIGGILGIIRLEGQDYLTLGDMPEERVPNNS